MKRLLRQVTAIGAAALLVACGGGSEEGKSESSGTPNVADARLGALAIKGTDTDSTKIDRRLGSVRGPVEVWVSLDQPSMAQKRAELAAQSGMERKRTVDALGKGGGEVASVSALMKAQRGALSDQQAKASSQLAGYGAVELGRVHVAHNAIAVRVDASQLSAIAAMPGVARVRPVVHYELMLGETVPYVGATTYASYGVDGAGTRIAVLDSGVDYTHRNLGGPGTVAAYNDCYAQRDVAVSGSCAALFGPAAPKVIGGYDFVGEAWPNDEVVEDPNPIDFEGHGTHVADIAAGRSADGTHRGVAPGAKILAVKVCSAVASSCNGVALLKGVDFALDPNGDGDLSDAVDVINMSLGSNYGQIEDDLTFAANNAVAVGTFVAASAGNGSNKPYVTGSPAIAPGVMSVAQTQVPSAKAIPLVVTAPASIAGTYSNTATLPWAPITAAVSGSVTYVGRGCATDPYPAGAATAGRILLIDRGSCVISEKVAKAAANGAIGVLVGLVAAGDAVSFSQGSPGPFVPSLVIQQTLSGAIKARLGAAQDVQVTLSPANAIPLLGGMVSSSSRGPATTQALKPEIGAPGASLSAEVGTGTENTPFGGTSGAAPMVAGAAALMIQVHQNLSPVKIKAMLMNSASTNVFTDPALAPGVRAPVSRTGAGELRVDRAIVQRSIALDTAAMTGGLGFGAHEVDRSLTLRRTLTVENIDTFPRTYTVKVKFREAADEASGAVQLSMTSRFTLPGTTIRNFPVTMLIDPSKLPTWTLDGGGQGGNGAALDAPEYDGTIEISDGNSTLSIPWHVLPRKAARTTALAWSPRQGANLRLRNTGAELGAFDLYSLTGVSPQLPDFPPRPGDNFVLIDLKHVGVRYLPASLTGGAGDLLEFAISVHQRRAHPVYPTGLEVQIDTNGDGIRDWAVFNTELGGFGASGQSAVVLFNIATGANSIYFFNDADLNSGVARFLVPMNTSGGFPRNLGVAPGQTITFDVLAIDNYFTGAITDTIEGMRFTPGVSRVSAAMPFGTVPTGGAVTTVPFTGNAAVTPAQSTERGVMLTYRVNAGEESQAIVMYP